jgi:hypothetical protein
MPIYNQVQTETITNGGGTFNLACGNSTTTRYVFSGTATLSSNWTIQPTGTPLQGMEFDIRWQSACTIGANSVTIFGTALTADQALNDLIITCYYNGSAWDVDINENILTGTWNKISDDLPSYNVNDDIYHDGKIGVGINSVTGYKIYNTDQDITISAVNYDLPSAKCQHVNGSGDIFTAGVEDTTAVPGGDEQSILTCFNPADLLFTGVIVRKTNVSMKYDDSTGGTTNSITVDVDSIDIALDTSCYLKITGLGNYVNDAAAAVGGVPVNGMYRNGSILMIRVV